jgi:hypothetical protein
MWWPMLYARSVMCRCGGRQACERMIPFPSQRSMHAFEFGSTLVGFCVCSVWLCFVFGWLLRFGLASACRAGNCSG